MTTSLQRREGLSASFSTTAGDLKLCAMVGDLTLSDEPPYDFTGSPVSLSVEKPGSFMVDYDIPKRDVRFQIMNKFNLFKRQMNLTYTHVRGENSTLLDGMLVLDPSRRLSVSHAFGSRNCNLRYSYVHKGTTAFEPSYDIVSNSWSMSVSKRVRDGDLITASYQAANRNLGLELDAAQNFKVSASFNLAGGLSNLSFPVLRVESKWDFEL